MSRYDVVQTVFDEFVTTCGLSRKSKSWYRRNDETIIVLTLSRFPYGRAYFLAVGVLLRALDADHDPKDAHCQIRSRLDRLVPAATEHRVNDLLDLQFPMNDTDRQDELLALLRSDLLPVMDASSTIDGLRSGLGAALVRTSTVTKEARNFLTTQSVS
jgi:hypothetical protein